MSIDIPITELVELLEASQLLSILIRLDRTAALCERTELTAPSWLDPARLAIEARLIKTMGRQGRLQDLAERREGEADKARRRRSP